MFIIYYLPGAYTSVAFFHKKSLDMAPLFRGKKTIETWVHLKKNQNFGCLPSIILNRLIFREKSLEMGTFFCCKNYP